MSSNLIDARGLGCPEPILLTRQALKVHTSGGFSVAVSNATARDNVVAFLDSSGFSPAVEEKQGDWFISVPKR